MKWLGPGIWIVVLIFLILIFLPFYFFFYMCTDCSCFNYSGNYCFNVQSMYFTAADGGGGG